MREIWKSIPGWEGYYDASNLGRIRSVDRVVADPNLLSKSRRKRLRSVVLQPTLDKGYLAVRLYRAHKGTNKKVHRLVIAAFRGDGALDVNHLDSDRSHNAIKNLEYVTRSQNMAHCVKQGRWRGPMPAQMAKAIRPDVEKIIALHKQGRNNTEIAQAVGVKCPKTIKVVLAGQHWTQR